MAGRAKEAEKMTLGIIAKSNSCIECYRLLSAIYSKQGNYTEVCVCVCVMMSIFKYFVLINNHSGFKIFISAKPLSSTRILDFGCVSFP